MFREAKRDTIMRSIAEGHLPVRATLGHGFTFVGPMDRWNEDWEEAVTWCRDQFGGSGARSRWFTCRHDLILCIDSAADATAFKIRWC